MREVFICGSGCTAMRQVNGGALQASITTPPTPRAHSGPNASAACSPGPRRHAPGPGRTLNPTCWYCLNSWRMRQPLSYANVWRSFWNRVLMRGMPRSQLSSRSSRVSRRFCGAERRGAGGSKGGQVSARLG